VNTLRKHFEGIDLDAHLPPSSVPETASADATITEAKQDTQYVSRPGRKRSETIDTVRRWLGKVSGISEQSKDREPLAGTHGLPTTPAAPDSSPLLSRRRDTISSTIPQLQLTGQSSTYNLLQRPATALLDVNAPLLPPIEIQNFARQASLVPSFEIGSASEDAEAEMRRVLEKVNARRVIHREHSGLHSLEEEALGAGYRVRLQRGSLGLVHVEVLE